MENKRVSLGVMAALLYDVPWLDVVDVVGFL